MILIKHNKVYQMNGIKQIEILYRGTAIHAKLENLCIRWVVMLL